MIGLAVELTSRDAQLALARDGAVVDVEHLPAGRRNSGLAIDIARRLLHRNDLGPTDLGVIYVSVGPGAFTGTRVAVTFAKMLAGLTGAALVAVPTADVVVRKVSPEAARRACVVFDARRGVVWTKQFETHDGEWRGFGTASLIPADRLVETLPPETLLIGEGIGYHRAALGDATVFEGDPFPRAETVVQLGHAALLRGETTAPETLLPIYLRRPEAEEKRLSDAASQPFPAVTSAADNG